MNKTIVVNQQPVTVSFDRYFDSAIGELYFRQVMCDVYMPGNEVVPIALEKEQIRLVVEGFKRRKALYDEVAREDIKGKPYYVITPAMRYDLRWLKGKPKLRLTKDKPPEEIVEDDAADVAQPQRPDRAEPKPPAAVEFADSRRRFLQSKGFRYNPETRNWEIHDIRLPDSRADKAASDEEFETNVNRLLHASYLSSRKRKPQK